MKKQVNRLSRKVIEVDTGIQEMRTGVSHPTLTKPMARMSQAEMWHHESPGHSDYDPRCDVCQSQRGIGRHLGQTGIAEVHFDFAMFNSDNANRKDGRILSEPKEKTRVLIGHGPEGEIFCRAVDMTSDKKAKMVAHVLLFLQKIGRRNPTLQVRTDGEVPLEKLVGDAVQQVKKSGGTLPEHDGACH